MKLAAFDIGSNTVLMVAVEVGAGGNPRVLAERSRITRLGRGVDAAGRLDPDSAARTLAAIEEFAAAARALGGSSPRRPRRCATPPTARSLSRA
jgi:exopolyphosphatase/guanosine-5'-triphosphate,3'-diphosphate pyrophosphatase